MASKKSYQQVSPQTQDVAIKIAKATQRPGQTKEQTKLISQGIQKGIEHYKKQHKAKSRELDKQLNKVKRQLANTSSDQDSTMRETIVYRQSKLAWILLLLSWMIFAVYFISVNY